MLQLTSGVYICCGLWSSSSLSSHMANLKNEFDAVMWCEPSSHLRRVTESKQQWHYAVIVTVDHHEHDSSSWQLKQCCMQRCNNNANFWIFFYLDHLTFAFSWWLACLLDYFTKIKCDSNPNPLAFYSFIYHHTTVHAGLISDKWW